MTTLLGFPPPTDLTFDPVVAVVPQPREVPLLTPPNASPQSVNRTLLPAAAPLPPVSDGPIDELLQNRIAAALTGNEDESAFFVADLGEVWKSWKSWTQHLSRVELFYAVKCNPDPVVLHLLSLLGTGFDCASQAEFTTVLSLPSPPPPSKIIFANPCKPVSFVRSAKRLGIDMMTFDNADEVLKIAKTHPGAKLVIRILTDDSNSLCRLGLKFGANLSSCPELLKLARDMGLDVIGVSFHVGSGCKDPYTFVDALERAQKVFKMGKDAGYDFKLLDVGGGFEQENFVETAEILSSALDLYFPRSMGVRIIGEPGRFVVSTAFTLATNIIARRAAGKMIKELSEVEDVEKMDVETVAEIPAADADDAAQVMYYINDGVYSSFNCIMFDHQIVHPFPLTLNGGKTSCPAPSVYPPNIALDQDLTLTMGYKREDSWKASIWGPTCDSIDCVRSKVWVPRGTEVGDWIGWGMMGAYTICAASTFNGFNRSTIHYTVGADPVASAAVARLIPVSTSEESC